jgi:hypothetical protein
MKAPFQRDEAIILSSSYARDMLVAAADRTAPYYVFTGSSHERSAAMEPASLTFGAETSPAGAGGATHIKTLIHLIDEAHRRRDESAIRLQQKWLSFGGAAALLGPVDLAHASRTIDARDRPGSGLPADRRGAPRLGE